MKRFPTVNISQSLHHRLDMYALAASATGVSLLALSSPSQAKIVYTAVHQQITNHTVLDLNHDGINDLALEPGSATQSDYVYVTCMVLFLAATAWLGRIAMPPPLKQELA